MKINIFGSTGVIGEKSLKLIKKNYPEIKINLLVANKNYKKLISQCKEYNPKYIYINNKNLIKKIKNKIKKNIAIINNNNLTEHLKNIKTDLTILAVSGYNALLYFEYILKNTKFLGLVNKELLVSTGHLIQKKNFVKNNFIFPLDSEHFSLLYFFNNSKINFNRIKKIYLTASGGPFLNFDIKKLDNVSLDQAVNHPKWKMGIKNSIDSATLANKCLELIEAHYLFNISYEKLDILIQPESLIHSIIEFDNGVSIFNYFYNDMDIPILNFFSYTMNNKIINIPKNYFIHKNFNLSFQYPDEKLFPIYKIYKKIRYKDVSKIIMFNVINEYAVELFKINEIKFTDISRFVDKYISLDLKMPITNIKNILEFQRYIREKIC